MNIYLLTRDEDRVIYDDAAGFVVAADTYGEARKLAASQAGDEGGLTWLDPQLVTVKMLATGANHPKGVVLRDFRAG
jgi:hypothetical protein